MSKIVFLNIPAHGHVNATLPVVQELVRRGEQVIYYDTEEFRPQIERAGAEFRAYPASDLTPATISAALADGNLANVSILLLDVSRQLAPFMVDELRREQPNLVVYDATAMWGKIACALLGLPCAATITTFVLDLKAARLNSSELALLLQQVLPKFPRQTVSRVRLARRFGKLAFATFPILGDRNIVFTARELQPDTPTLDETFRFVGPSIDPQSRSEGCPFDMLTGGKVVYISLGTIHHNVDFYRACFEAFADYPAQFILSAGKDTNLDALHAPANFIVRPTVPQLEVLQHSDVFITHGGINGVHEGLYYGVPLIVIPHQFEQLLNARCIEAQGAALVLRDQVVGGHVTAAQLRQSLDTVLADQRYHDAALKAQETLRATGGYRQAADELQAFVAEGKVRQAAAV